MAPSADTSGMRMRYPIGWLAGVIIVLCVSATADANQSSKPVSKRVDRARHACTRTHVHRGRDLSSTHAGHGTTNTLTAAPAPAPITIPAPTGTIYYVSPAGSDAASGTSPAEAWQTVEQVDRASLKPGDEVLFEGGATFSDDALMPGWGESVSGTSAAPIGFGSYGQGQARITQGVWFKSDNNLAFQSLTLGGDSGIAGAGFQGNGEGITVLHTTIEHAGLGINAEGANWTIAHNTINDTGDSGMLLGYTAGAPGEPAGGSNFLVTGNTISNTGLNAAITYGTHGIYDKVANSTITDNTISHFHDDGISVRYRDSTISGNRLSYGAVGLAWFQYDTTAGTSRWTDNSISHMSAAGIFVCGIKQGCLPALESFQISGGAITDYGASEMNLQPTSGTYSVAQPRPARPISFAASRSSRGQSGDAPRRNGCARGMRHAWRR
jgi:Right handed beta helix region